MTYKLDHAKHYDDKDVQKYYAPSVSKTGKQRNEVRKRLEDLKEKKELEKQ